MSSLRNLLYHLTKLSQCRLITLMFLMLYMIHAIHFKIRPHTPSPCLTVTHLVMHLMSIMCGLFDISNDTQELSNEARRRRGQALNLSLDDKKVLINTGWR